MIYRQSLKRKRSSSLMWLVRWIVENQALFGVKLMNNCQFQYETQYLKSDHLVDNFGIKKIINQYQLNSLNKN